MEGRASIIAMTYGSAALLVTAALGQEQSQTWPSVISSRKSQTVLVRVESEGVPPDYGSGVLISGHGYILTAKHILPRTDKVLQGDYLISTLSGWDRPSIDFSKSLKAKIAYVSPDKDFAVLKLVKTPANAKGACVGAKARVGHPLLVMGYPGGGNLRNTQGIVSGQAAEGMWATDAAVGRGNSGGPVFDEDGGLIGILLQGSARGNNGDIVLGFFLPTSPLLPTLSARHLSDAACVSLPTAASLPGRLSFSYHVSEMESDHDGLSPSTRDYQRSFYPQPGYRIVSAAFKASSANHVTHDPEIIIEHDGSSALIKYSIVSGPVFDQWRGWLDGELITEQQPKGVIQ